jgi:hypothetical protein
MIQATVKQYDLVTVFFSSLCEGCDIWGCVDISYQEYYESSDEELIAKYCK